MKIEIFESDLLSLNRLTSEKADENLDKLSENTKILKNEFENLEILRYSPKTHLNSFIENNIISNFLREYGSKILPITIMNDRVIRIGDYPSLEELKSKLALNE